jgi:hypothetical protein
MAEPVRRFDMFWPLSEPHLRNADVAVIWARPSEVGRLPPRVRAQFGRRRLHGIHRRVERVIYTQSAAADADPPLVVVLCRLHDALHMLLVADVRTGGRIRVVLSAALRDVLNVKVGQPAYDDDILPRLQRTYAVKGATAKKSPT